MATEKELIPDNTESEAASEEPFAKKKKNYVKWNSLKSFKFLSLFVEIFSNFV